MAMIILSPLRHFNSCLVSSKSFVSRTRTAKSTQFVTTLADFETFLLRMAAGFMPKLVFILPRDQSTYDERGCAPFEVWLSSQRVLEEKNCHWA